MKARLLLVLAGLLNGLFSTGAQAQPSPATGQWTPLAAPQRSPAPLPSWEPLPGQPAEAPSSGIVPWEPLPDTASGKQRRSVDWQPLPASDAGLNEPRPSSSGIGPPSSAAEAEALLQGLIPLESDYLPLLRLGQLPTATFFTEGDGELTFQQVTPGNGGQAGGSGNQNYAFRVDLALLGNLMLAAYYSYADDPLFAPITVRPSQPANLWTVYGANLRARLADFNSWTLAAEGSLELFTVGSGCGGAGADCAGSGTPNIFNDSGQKVFTRNWVGSISLPLSWQASPQLQLSFVPAMTLLPASQGAGQGGSGTFYGTNLSLGFGANWRLATQMQLFGSAMLPLGPGTNAFDGQLNFFRVPILTAGTRIAVNPRIGLEASITNGFGLSPATAILALPSAPDEPLLSTRFIWTPTALDSPSPRFTARQASLALGGITVNTALTPADATTQLWANGDSSGNLLGSVAYSVSNDFQFEVAGGVFNSITPTNPFISTFLGSGALNLRFGGKAMVLRPSKAFPIWAGGRVTVGRAGGSTGQGYLFFDQTNTWEATPNLAFHLNPKLAWSGSGTSWGVGLGANVQLGRSFQLIPELNLVGTDLGGQNGSNGSLALRWLASQNTSMDLYVSNAVGLLDLGQLLRNDVARVGMKMTLQF